MVVQVELLLKLSLWHLVSGVGFLVSCLLGLESRFRCTLSCSFSTFNRWNPIGLDMLGASSVLRDVNILYGNDGCCALLE